MKNIAEFQIIGRIGSISHSEKVTHMTIAANYRRKAGEEWREEPYWNRVTIFGERDRAYIAQHVGQGDLVRVKGVMKDTKFERGGETFYSTDRIAEEFGVLAKANQLG